ncbi:hypothetical protein K440DRAFT_615596 [Wilcoxina mikolae CBS 423.85]|nr:hypothetical protein K440DRAFT_615596 [Wilcoxina mikolae CBS 423.85]
MFRLTTTSRLPPTLRTVKKSIATRTRQYTSPSSSHTVNKPHELDVQSHSSKQGMREHEASGERGAGEKKADPKKEHPKAPEPVIGMQDERGHSKGN